MIAFLQGKPQLSGSDLVVVVNGVGYQVAVGAQLLAEAAHQEEVTLHVHTHVREDALELYGFRTTEEKQLFLLLLAVSGVGPRIALAISEKGPQAITTAVQQADIKFFSAVPRVGKKLAQKIIIDLKGKLGSLKELELGPTSSTEQEIVQALASMGFDEDSVLSVIRQEDYSQVEIEVAIKQIIQKLGKV